MGVLLECGSLIGASFATDVWQLYLGQGLGFSFGVGFFLVSTQNTVVQWFSKHRSLASGIAVSGTGIGGLAYSLAAGHLIEKVGTGMALRTLAIIAGCTTFVASLLVRDTKGSTPTTLLSFDLKFLRRPPFVALLLFASFNMLGEIIILTQLSTFGQSVLGLDTTQASIIGAMICCGQGLGRIALGYTSDVFGRLNMAAMVSLLAGIWTLIMWPLSGSYGILILYSIIIGAFA